MNKRRRATKQEMASRISTVKTWIVETNDELDFKQTIRRMEAEWAVGRRQAIRYWVAARVALMDDVQRYKRRFHGPMLVGRHGCYRSRPCLLAAERVQH